MCVSAVKLSQQAGVYLRSWSCVFVQILYCKCVCVVVVVGRVKFRTGQVLGRCDSLCGASVRTGWVLVCFITFSLQAQGHQLPKSYYTLPRPAHTYKDTALRIHSHHWQHTVLWNTTLLQTVPKISITGHSACVSAGYFLICVSCVQSECYESSWLSPSPVVSVINAWYSALTSTVCHYRLLVWRAHHTVRGRGLMSALVLCMSWRGGFMGAIALTVALIIARWTSDHWLPQWSNYTIHCPLHPFCSGPV